uniref:Lanosterol synthase (2,3-oxidosqualene-lanosterol cyclase) n=2 Tax=Cyprinus carpio TaxID=7962 RepID=A0A9J8AJZ3_CYPCA
MPILQCFYLVIGGLIQVFESVTDLSSWRLSNVEGRQTWRYIEEADHVNRQQSMLESHSLGLDMGEFISVSPATHTAVEAALKGMDFYSRLQAEDGHWAEDYGGPLFLLPVKLIIFYKDTVFRTALNYTALRILGLGPDDPDMVQERNNLHSKGGAVGISSWIFFLNQAVPFLGASTSFHFMVPLSSDLPAHELLAVVLFLGVKQELYVQEYSSIDWQAQRNNTAACDLYTPHSTLLTIAYLILNVYELYDHIKADDHFSNQLLLGERKEKKFCFILCNVSMKSILTRPWFYCVSFLCACYIKIICQLLFIHKYCSVYETNFLFCQILKTDNSSGGLDYCRRVQRPAGSWEGSRGVCFTYGVWFGLEAFACMGHTFQSGYVICLFHAVEGDGGWGEDFESCEQQRYVQSKNSQIHNTCWALLGLMAVCTNYYYYYCFKDCRLLFSSYILHYVYRHMYIRIFYDSFKFYQMLKTFQTKLYLNKKDYYCSR